MKRHLLLFCLLHAFCLHANAQRKAAGLYEGDSTRFIPEIRLGTSLTYIWNPYPEFLREYTWALNVAFTPFRKFHVGANFLKIWSRSLSEPKGRHMLGGAFAQYHIGNPAKITLAPELGYYRGNYCTCGPQDPYLSKNLNYLSVGAGLNGRLYKGLGLEVGFLVYQILDRIPLKYSYTQYVIGLNYDIRLAARHH